MWYSTGVLGLTIALHVEKRRSWVQPHVWKAWSHTVCPWSLSHRRTTPRSESRTWEMYETLIAVAEISQWLINSEMDTVHNNLAQSGQKTITWATDSFSKWALEPQEIPILSWMHRQAFLVMTSHNWQACVCVTEEWDKHTGLGLSSLSPASTFSRSGNFVAPSASAIRMSFPLELIVPFDRDKQHMKSHTHTQKVMMSLLLLMSYHPHSSSFTPVLRQRQDPHFICTILPSVLQSNLVGVTTNWIEGSVVIN